MIVLKDVMAITPIGISPYGERVAGLSVDYPCQVTGILEKIEAIKSVAINGVFELKSTIWTMATVPVKKGDLITIKKVSGINIDFQATVVGITNAGKYKGLLI